MQEHRRAINKIEVPVSHVNNVLTSIARGFHEYLPAQRLGSPSSQCRSMHSSSWKRKKQKIKRDWEYPTLTGRETCSLRLNISACEILKQYGNGFRYVSKPSYLLGWNNFLLSSSFFVTLEACLYSPWGVPFLE
jgi:hypothetical protein